MLYTTVENIILNCYSDLGGGATDENHKRYFQWVKRGYKQLRLFKLSLNVATTLPVQSGVRCVVIPNDYISFVGIGKVINNTLSKFSEKGDLIPRTTESCGIETQTEIHPSYQDRGGYATGGGGNLWYYRLDEGNNRILIDGAPLIEATLVYKSSGETIDGKTLIPSMAEEALIAWVHWQEALNEKGISGVEKELRYKVFVGAINDIDLLTWNSDAMMDAVYSTIYQGVKR